MENGVARLFVEEKTNVGNEGLRDKVEKERVVAGSDESKGVEDEAFEEAIESLEQLHEEEEEEEEENETVVDESSNLGNETEKFEEAIFVPAESGNPEELGGVGGEEKVDEMVGEDSADKIDEGGTAKEAKGNESSGGEVAEVISNGVIEVLKAEGEGEVDSKQEIKLDEEIPPKDDEREELKEDGLGTEYQATSGDSANIFRG
ncbi:hypothetical protein OIU84_009395 [Salix udensis]|uniref:Uncharacterized protein n=1 Tax=Salix udensis TaxID=889485 RepID=A0AAD6JRB4_9ROSI|nr:hypothetical protein OIU84_009395 [Salix udensis]